MNRRCAVQAAAGRSHPSDSGVQACRGRHADNTRQLRHASYAHSPDERQLAWSAWIAGHDRVDAAQPMLEQIVAERIDTDGSSPPVDYALDALIQLEARLTPDLLARIVERRPVEGLILLSYVDDGTADGVLLDTLGRERGYEWFAAANLLTVRRPAGYAARLLSGLRIRARITISDSGEDRSFSGDVGGIGCGIAERHPGMPPWPSYSLTPYAQPGVVVLATGPTAVYYERRVTGAGTGPSRGGTNVDGPTGADRLRYVEALTGVTPALTGDDDRGVKRRPGLAERSTAKTVIRRSCRRLRAEDDNIDGSRAPCDVSQDRVKSPVERALRPLTAPPARPERRLHPAAMPARLATSRDADSYAPHLSP